MANEVTERPVSKIESMVYAKNKNANQKSLPQNNQGAKTQAKDQKKNVSASQSKGNQRLKKIKDAERDVYAYIDASNAILELLPDFVDNAMDAISNNSFPFSLNSLALLMYILRRIGVTEEKLKKFLVGFLIGTLPEAEMGAKALLLSNIKSIMSCSADPRIPKQLRQRNGEYYFDKVKYLFSEFTGKPKVDERRGMLIDCNSIDPEGILSYSPCTDKGKNYYFGVVERNIDSKIFYENLSLDEARKDIVDTIGVEGMMKSKWELCRADDKDALLWFAMHVARFPSPTPITTNGNHVTINGQEFITQNGTNANVLSPMELNLVSSGSSSISVGSTIINKNNPSEIAICIKTEFEDDPKDLDGGTRVTKNVFVPLSKNWNSVDWYVDRSKYYAFYSHNKFYKSIYDYDKQNAICNVQFMQPTDYDTTYVGGSTQKFNLTILPKPYVYVPYSRILFDAYGNPDPNGNFSLPTEKMTKDNLPYVHNDKIFAIKDIKRLNDAIDDIESNPKEFYDVFSMVYYETANGEPSSSSNPKSIALVKNEIIRKYENSFNIKALSIAFRGFQVDSEDTFITKSLKAKTVSILNDCYQTLVAKEGGSAEKGVIKLTVGEKEDNCSLYIRKDDGSYYLGPSSGTTRQDYTKHLVRCYNGLTVYEFNYDYLMGMRLFDPKVVCAKLLETATNPSFDTTYQVGLSRNSNKDDSGYIGDKQSITEIVRKIIEEEDTELSDCFFKFDNSDYARMLQDAEEKRFKQQPYLNDKTHTVDLSDVYEILQNYPELGTKQEQEEVLTNAISAATAKVRPNTNIYAKQDSKNLKINFATNLISILTATLVHCLLSPKVLMLIAVNKQLMGNGGEEVSTKELLKGMESLIVNIVKEIEDLVVKQLLDYVLEYLSGITTELNLRIAKEAFSVFQLILSDLLLKFNQGKQYVNRLNSVLQGLLSKFGDLNNGKGKDYDLPTILDNVDYADIIKLGNGDKPANNNC